jgi:hypothetical protein
MTDFSEQFKRFREEHARLHDPALTRGTVELAPVNLSEIASQVIGSRKKKKKRRGLRASWAPAQAPFLPDVETSEGEPLLPPDFIQQLRTHAQQQATHGTSPRVTIAETTQGRTHLEIRPQNVRRRLSLFQEQVFTVDAPGAGHVELVWEEQRCAADDDTMRLDGVRTKSTKSNTWPDEFPRVAMDHQEADRFEAQVGLPDGKYLVAFAIDGRTHPPQHLAQRVVLNKQGVFAPLELARQQETFILTNGGATDERVWLETEVPWLVPGDSIDLPAGTSAKTLVRFDPSTMKPGLNEGLLHLRVKRGEETISVGVVQVAVELEAGGSVGEFSFTPQAFGEILQGLDEVKLEVNVTARGRGPLNGMISLPQSGELIDFRLDADDEMKSRFSHTFHIHSSHLPLPQPNTAEAALKLMILTDSFLANYRLCRFNIPYRLLYLKKSLPALSFGTIRSSGTKTMRLQVERSDAGDIELGVVLPPATQRFLEAYPARGNVFVFRLDAAQLPPGTHIDETIELTDRKSGLRDRIKILATITQSTNEPAYVLANSEAH